MAKGRTGERTLYQALAVLVLGQQRSSRMEGDLETGAEGEHGADQGVLAGGIPERTRQRVEPLNHGHGTVRVGVAPDRPPVCHRPEVGEEGAVGEEVWLPEIPLLAC